MIKTTILFILKITAIQSHQRYPKSSPKSQKTENTSRTSKPVVIYFWKEPFIGFEHNWHNEYHGCGSSIGPGNHCLAIYNTKRSNKNLVYSKARAADVVVMSPLFDPSLTNLDFDEVAKIRRKEQIWVWFQWESPQFHGNDLKKYDNFFNATLSYRFDSTFWFPYSSMIKNKLTWFFDPSYRSILKNDEKSAKSESYDILKSYPNQTDRWNHKIAHFEKQKTVTDKELNDNLKNGPNLVNDLGVAAAISNCEPQYRGKLVEKLSNMLRYPNGDHALDIFGACRNRYQKYESKTRDFFQNNTMQRGTHQSLPQTLKNYKFFLSFENSRCRHYITEKFFSNAYLSNSVPIVAGPPREDYEFVAPADSFIHVDDFATVEKLAERVNFLMDPANEVEYRKFFEWKNRLNDGVHLNDLKENRKSGLCGLCNAAFEIKNGIKDWDFGVVKDLQTWWYGTRRTVRSFSKFRNYSGVNWTESSEICLKNDFFN